MTTRPGQVKLDLARPMTAYIHNVYANREDDGCPPRYLCVVIYPELDSLNKAAAAYSKRLGVDTDLTWTGDQQAAGCFQPRWMRSKFDRKAKVWKDTNTSFAGVMRLSQSHLTARVISHESVHAALHIARMERWRISSAHDSEIHLEDSSGPVEEAFAHLVGDLTSEVSDFAWKVLDLQKSS